MSRLKNFVKICYRLVHLFVKQFTRFVRHRSGGTDCGDIDCETQVCETDQCDDW